ncbi:MAG: hypothetical protein QM796_16535 [Chthoniobacteraceae bacterium]
MDWIKKNLEKCALGLLAAALLATSVLLILKAQAFKDVFADITAPVPQNDKIKSLDSTAVGVSLKDLATKPTWDKSNSSLFVSQLYILKDGKLIQPDTDSGSAPVHPPVPNSWFKEHDLDVLSPTVLTDDPDGDGFTNLDEYEGKTDPQDKNSHPPYYTKLRLERFIQKPFRVILKAYDGDPKQPDSLTFQINTVDIRQPTLFLKINDPVPNTKFKIMSFEAKTSTNSSTGATDDVSELTLQNTETGDKVILIVNKLIDSPDSYALFKYLWNGKEFAVKKNKTFSVDPETNIQYKVIDITSTEATIQDPSGKPIKIPALEK